MATQHDWWWEERVHRTVTVDFINQRFPSKEHQRKLLSRVDSENGRVDETYLWIIKNKAARIFLILIDIKSIESIFDAIDSGCVDADLPLTNDEIWGLHLINQNKGLIQQFETRQCRYTLREPKEGKHVEYKSSEIVPVEVLGSTKVTNSITKKIIPSTSIVDIVRINSRKFLRRKVALASGKGRDGADPKHFRLHFASLHKFSHPHLISVWGTYSYLGYGYVLLTPAPEQSLKHFFDDPKFFKELSKQHQRETLLKWTHCLSSALTFLHDLGQSHQAIFPGNIFIDEGGDICLGFYSALDELETREINPEQEIYTYAAPELLTSASFRPTAVQTMVYNGGRTGRRIKDADSVSVSTKHHASRPSYSSISPTSPTSPLPQNDGLDNMSFAMSQILSRATGQNVSAASTPSLVSSHASSGRSNGSGNRASKPPRAYVTDMNFSMPNEHTRYDHEPMYPSDVFSLNAVFVTMLTFLLSLSESKLKNILSSNKISISAMKDHFGKGSPKNSRGDAVHDTSFHQNLDQVASWLTVLAKAADQNSKTANKEKDEGESSQWRGAIGGLLFLAKDGLSKKPLSRISSPKETTAVKELLSLWGINVGDCCLSVSLDSSLDAIVDPMEQASLNDARKRNKEFLTYDDGDDESSIQVHAEASGTYGTADFESLFSQDSDADTIQQHQYLQQQKKLETTPRHSKHIPNEHPRRPQSMYRNSTVLTNEEDEDELDAASFVETIQESVLDLDGVKMVDMANYSAKAALARAPQAPVPQRSASGSVASKKVRAAEAPKRVGRGLR